jgi:hypothetical protein
MNATLIENPENGVLDVPFFQIHVEVKNCISGWVFLYLPITLN